MPIMEAMLAILLDFLDFLAFGASEALILANYSSLSFYLCFRFYVSSKNLL